MKITKLTGNQVIKIFDPKLTDKIVEDKEFFLIEVNEFKLVFEEVPAEDDMYLILRNNDFTSGSGPMVFHKISKSLIGAIEYIMKQSGIFGSKQYITTNVGVNINGGPYAYTYFNGYDIKVIKSNDIIA